MKFRSLVGYAMESLTALFTVQQHPSAFSMLVLYGFPVDPNVVQLCGQASVPAVPARAAATSKAAAEDFVFANAVPQYVVDAIENAMPASIDAIVNFIERPCPPLASP